MRWDRTRSQKSDGKPQNETTHHFCRLSSLIGPKVCPKDFFLDFFHTDPSGEVEVDRSNLRDPWFFSDGGWLVKNHHLGTADLSPPKKRHMLRKLNVSATQMVYQAWSIWILMKLSRVWRRLWFKAKSTNPEKFSKPREFQTLLRLNFKHWKISKPWINE